MPIPTHEDAMLPLLKLLSDGRPQQRRALSDAIAEHFQLSPEERDLLLPSGKAPVVRSRTGWALTYLKQAGLVDATRRGWYLITQAGRDTLRDPPTRIDNVYLTRFERFREFQTRSRSDATPIDQLGSAASATQESDNPAATPPDEALDIAYFRLRANVETELLDSVKRMSPRFLRNL